MARKSALSEVSSRGIASATRASAVYEQLREDIAHGQLAPGAKLRVEAMCQRYGVGASPLREALSRLSAEGWVDRTDLRGFSVAPLHWDELPILTRNRIQLESLALRESIAQRDAALEDALVLLMHRLSRTPRSLSTARCCRAALRAGCAASATAWPKSPTASARWRPAAASRSVTCMPNTARSSRR
jgi:DNA-binding GntR family transcriptional regulator